MKCGIYVRSIPAPCDCTLMLLTWCVTQPNSYQDSVRQDGENKVKCVINGFKGSLLAGFDDVLELIVKCCV